MDFTELTSNNIKDILNEGGLTAKEGEKVIYLVSSRWDAPYRDEPAWADKYEGTAELYLCVVENIDVELWFGELMDIDEIPGLPAFIHYLMDGTLDYINLGAPFIDKNVVHRSGRLVSEGNDYLVYDRFTKKLGILEKSTMDNEFDRTRYITNGDVITGVTGGWAHGVAPKFADEVTGGLNDYTAAAHSHYRINITGATGSGTTTTAGSFSFTSTTGNKTQTGSVSWASGATLDSIRTQITGLGDYTSVVVTEDKLAIGIALGGYGVNTFELSSPQGCTLEDCTTKAVYSGTIKSGDSYNSGLSVINNSHKSWRGSEARSILNSYLTSIGLQGLHTASSTAIDMLGQNRQYRCVINKAGARSWGGDSDTFVADGAGGTTSGGIGIMKKTVFDNNVNSGATGTGLTMYNFYSKLLAGNSSIIDDTPSVNGMTFASLKSKLESRFGTMSDLYDAYLMMHGLNIDATSGITNIVRNKGVYETHIMGRIFTVDYNHKYYPAYPPAYNTLVYEHNSPIYNAMVADGIEDPQLYSQPEPYDLGVEYSDTIMARINAAQADAMISVSHTALSNSNYTGSFAQSNAYHSWYFTGDSRVLYDGHRYYTSFRSRPSPAFRLPGVA